MSFTLRRLRPAMSSVGKARQLYGLVSSAPSATASSAPILGQRRKSTAAESAAAIAQAESTRGPRCSPGLVVFDKDGTLIDFTLMWGGWVESQAWKVEMTTGLPVREKLFAAMGYDWISRSIKSKGALCCTPMGELYKLAADEVITKCWSMPDPVLTSRPLANIPALFRTIKKMDMKIAVCTTDDRQPTIDTLEHLGVSDMVDALACGDDGLPAKPAGEQIWTICQQLNVEPHNTIMVGDTSTDMLLGKNAGCGLSIGVLGGASSLDDLAEDADVLVPSIDRVIKVLFQYGQQAQRFGDAK
ncbi:Transcriptional activator Myb [Phytophthora nicotianae]|uniref:Transcriptional activator Myb n=1 Tax=Phytophthora nicotianae TaxID=4792 RepID=A0A0W8DPG7_PHYNI|nr:Transcriptional activator Myb [Phytophthora nicotianae]